MSRFNPYVAKRSRSLSIAQNSDIVECKWKNKGCTFTCEKSLDGKVPSQLLYHQEVVHMPLVYVCPICDDYMALRKYQITQQHCLEIHGIKLGNTQPIPTKTKSELTSEELQKLGIEIVLVN